MAKLSASTIWKVAREVRAADSASRLVVAGGGEAAAALTIALSGGPGASQPAGLWLLEGGPLTGIHKSDVMLVAAGDDAAQAAAAIAGAREAGSGLVVALPPGEPARRGAARGAGAYEDELIEADVFSPQGVFRLIEAIAREAGQNGPALAAAVPAVRRAVVQRLIRRVASENAAVGAIVFVPGADLPMMTLNQVRMVLQIGAAYGRDVSAQRAPEIIGVVGAALGFRAVARQAMGFVPVGGWAIKGVMGYAGTLAVGEAAVKYYETGVLPVDPTRVKGLLNKVAGRRKARQS